ncbi:MAG: glycosyltransferase family 2 protein [Phycisphaerales bacterium]|nr:glycosyltransferase family 2 protein [Phycisphaerales bacterium]
MDASHDTPDLAVAITAFNSMRTIERALESVRGLARVVVVVDSGSTDGTPERCREMGAMVVHHPWSGYGEQKRISIAQCAGHEWTLVLDSDESVEPRLRESIKSALARSAEPANGYEVNRKIWFLGGWLNHTFQPEWRLRLFRTSEGRVVGDLHEAIVVDGGTRRLAGDLRHDSFRDMDDMLRRHLNYASVLAAHDGRGGTIFRILVSPSAAFLKQLLLRRGFLDGWRGVLAAGGMAACALMKHLLLAQRRHFGPIGDTRSNA